MSAAKAWTADEIDAVISLYFAMRVLVEYGEKFNKRQLIREQQSHYDSEIGCTVAGPLADRSRGSVEMKLMNVTACIESLDAPEFSMAEHGYRPLYSYQAALRIAVEKHIIGEYSKNARKFRATL